MCEKACVLHNKSLWEGDCFGRWSFTAAAVTEGSARAEEDAATAVHLPKQTGSVPRRCLFTCELVSCRRAVEPRVIPGTDTPDTDKRLQPWRRRKNNFLKGVSPARTVRSDLTTQRKMQCPRCFLLGPCEEQRNWK
ncbi:hypothetical protein OJAV_G00125380 [Oryzias javanicus]|uniref:Uncharacterized protein n=1 Tax=Oryzias javanicus TaxID=123683 RepID=A0A437CNI9_ORYJA|nr:hypothetical protein OJAV_G00125380 [Oryzias javanicus]